MILFAASAAVTGQPASFRDPGLKAAIEARLHVANPTPADMPKPGYLVANERAIADLTGLEYATNLATLNLSYNSISDRSALKGLVNLTRQHFLSRSPPSTPRTL